MKTEKSHNNCAWSCFQTVNLASLLSVMLISHLCVASIGFLGWFMLHLAAWPHDVRLSVVNCRCEVGKSSGLTRFFSLDVGPPCLSGAKGKPPGSWPDPLCAFLLLSFTWLKNENLSLKELFLTFQMVKKRLFTYTKVPNTQTEKWFTRIENVEKISSPRWSCRSIKMCSEHDLIKARGDSWII